MIDNKIIKSEIIQAIQSLIEDSSVELNESTALLGGDGLMDSMSLVELCLILEDKASELGFEFDWTSDSAMSRSRSMFRSVGSLTDEMIRQMEEQQ
ncbi:MAG: acyl carrier protein [Gammaproteobacteria bacterium]|nr:acyl carrier protein [Gammaproteobacteria bacterium]